MKSLNNLVKKNLLLNKQRSIVTIIGIILSCALITATFTLAISFQASLLKQSKERYGNRIVTIYDVPLSDSSYITANKEVSSSYMTSNTSSTDSKGDILDFVYIDKKGLLDLEHLLVEGSVPVNDNEIVVTHNYFNNNDLQIGDIVTIEIGENSVEPSSNSLGDNSSSGEFITKEVKEYKLVGVIKDYTFLGGYNDCFYVVSNDMLDKVDIHLLYNNPKNYDQITNELTFFDGNNTRKYQISYNQEYLRWAGYSTNDETKSMIYLMIIIVSGIIMTTSIFCIRNAFAISTVEKTRQYGILSSLGVTRKQIKRMVLKQGVYLGLIAIPLGIICGLFASKILILVINYFINNGINTVEFIFRTSYAGILLSVVLTSITIYLSSIAAARKASKITQIEAIKNSNDIKIKGKKLRTPKIIEKLFKIGGVFAYKNMKRNKSKFRTTIISLVVSVATFISLSYFINIGVYSMESLYKTYKHNVTVEVLEEDCSSDEVNKVYSDILKLGNIKKYVISKETGVVLKDAYTKYWEDTLQIKDVHINLYSLNDSEYTAYLKEIGAKDNIGGVLVNNSADLHNADNKYEKTINIIDTSKDKLEVYSNDQYIDKIDYTESSITPMGLQNWSGLMLIVNEDFISRVDNVSNGTLYIDSSNPSELTKKINEYYESKNIELSFYNIEENVKAINNMITLISIFLYGFIIVIILIGLTNIFNTITTNMILRRREFAILKSIGMSNREFNNLINLESIFYGIKALLYGIVFGVGLSYLIYLAYTSSEASLIRSFELPIMSIIISIVFVFLIIFLIMRLSLSKINKQNIIEVIRKETI